MAKENWQKYKLLRLLELLQQETDEAFRYLVIKSTPSFGGLHDIRGAVNRTAIGAILSMKELLDIADSLYVVQKKAYKCNTCER